MFRTLICGASAMALTVTLCLGASPALAKTEKKPLYEAYECNLDKGRANFMSTKVYLLRDVVTQERLIYDGPTNEVYGKPLPVTVKTDNAERLELSWSVKGLKAGGTSMKVTGRYFMIFFKKTLQASLKVTMSGYDNKDRLAGGCVLMTK